MATPTMARISAYSAAEAPDSSARKVLIKLFMVVYPKCHAPAARRNACVLTKGAGLDVRCAPAPKGKVCWNRCDRIML